MDTGKAEIYLAGASNYTEVPQKEVAEMHNAQAGGITQNKPRRRRLSGIYDSTSGCALSRGGNPIIRPLGG
jgi:hypothetical protein